MDQPSQLSEFDRTTSLSHVPGIPGSYRVDLAPEWSSLVGVHGGYLCALAVKSAEDFEVDRVVRTISTSFLRVAEVGPAELTVTQLRRGRTMSTVTVEISQSGKTLLSSRLTLSVPRGGVEWTEPRNLDLPPVEQCVRFDGGRVIHFARVDGVIDPHTLPSSGGERAVLRGYVRPLENRRLDAAWLAMAADWFPPPAFVRVEPPTGGMSVDLTIHIHQPEFVLEPGEWLQGLFEIHTSTRGFAVEHGVITTSGGVPVVESFQTRLTALD